MKRFLIIFASLILVLLCFADASQAGVRLRKVYCSTPTPIADWPRNTFKAQCSAKIKGRSKKEFSLGVSLGSYLTKKIRGNGPVIDIRLPEKSTSRLRVKGPEQMGLYKNIGTGKHISKATIIKKGIKSEKNINFEIAYTTYEADHGDTTYRHRLYFNLYKKNGKVKNSRFADFVFTTENRQYLDISGPLFVELSPADMFNFNKFYDSNTVTVTVKSNNYWLLQSKINGDPALLNYYRTSGIGFNNFAPRRRQFTKNNIFYNLASSKRGKHITGSYDGINLSGLDIAVTYSLLYKTVLAANIYKYDTLFNLVSPIRRRYERD